MEHIYERDGTMTAAGLTACERNINGHREGVINELNQYEEMFGEDEEDEANEDDDKTPPQAFHQWTNQDESELDPTKTAMKMMIQLGDQLESLHL